MPGTCLLLPAPTSPRANSHYTFGFVPCVTHYFPVDQFVFLDCEGAWPELACRWQPRTVRAQITLSLLLLLYWGPFDRAITSITCTTSTVHFYILASLCPAREGELRKRRAHISNLALDCRNKDKPQLCQIRTMIQVLSFERGEIYIVQVQNDLNE